jgi:hypothetical protein
MTEWILVATPSEVLRVDASRGTLLAADGFDRARPTGLAADPWVAGRAWCCTRSGGIFRSDDAGATWSRSGLDGENLMAVVASPARAGLLWAGGEPSAIWRSDDEGRRWGRAPGLEELPSSSTWAFPPRPETHHVRWIAPHPADPDRLWVAIEAGALVGTTDGGRSWIDRVAGGPYDTHELAIHPAVPDVLRVSAGDGYFESRDAGITWSSPMDGLEVGYLRSVAIEPGDPEVTLVSAARSPRTAYVAGRSDGRIYRRAGNDGWVRVTDGWPDPPSTIAPLLIPGGGDGEMWAADERGVHRSFDGGEAWRTVHAFHRTPDHLRGIALVRSG